MKYLAVKYSLDLNSPVFTEYEQAEYISDSLENAVQACLYTLRLKNGKAEIGPSGQVLYDGFGFMWCIVPMQRDENGNFLIYKDGLWYRSPVDELSKTE